VLKCPHDGLAPLAPQARAPKITASHCQPALKAAMYFAARLIACLVLVVGVSVAAAWAWDRSDTPVRQAQAR
jgi:hypothetical protein